MKNPLYKAIFNDYMAKINTNTLKKDEKLPTEMEIAQKYNVSRITATRALRELEINDLIYKIKGSGSYVKEQNNKINNKNSLSIISLILPFDLTLSFDLFSSIENVAKEKGFFVTFHNSYGDSHIENDLIQELIEQGSKGLIIYPVSSTKNTHLFNNLLIDNFPFVLIDRKVMGVDAPVISADNFKGFYEITKKLLLDDHRKILFLSNLLLELSSELDRYRGYCKAFEDVGVPLFNNHKYNTNEYLNIPDDYRPNKTVEDKMAHLLFDYLESLDIINRPTAIACVNDEIAEVLQRIAFERQIKFPEDYSITGFDDLPFASRLQVPLTTVSQPRNEIGKIATMELFNKIENKNYKIKSQLVNTKLIIRNSTNKLSTKL